jgi:hypothetical protein
VTRTAPWLWSVAFHSTDTPVMRWVLRRLPTRWAVPPIATALERHRPAVVVVAHPLAVAAAVTARGSSGPALVTVVTDLATAHGTWWHRHVDRTIIPSARLLRAGLRAGAGCTAVRWGSPYGAVPPQTAPAYRTVHPAHRAGPADGPVRGARDGRRRGRERPMQLDQDDHRPDPGSRKSTSSPSAAATKRCTPNWRPTQVDG